MKRLTNNLLISHSAVFLIIGFGIWFLMNQLFPEVTVKGFALIPLFFYLLGLIFIFLFNRTKLDKPINIMKLYMLMRVIKLFASLAFVSVIWMTDKDNGRYFAIVFIVFFFLSLFWETYMYMKVERFIKASQENQPIEEDNKDK